MPRLAKLTGYSEFSHSLDPLKTFDQNTGTAGRYCDFNRSMQHLDSHYREEDVENEVSDEDLLH